METTQKQKSLYGVRDFTRDEKIFKEEIEPRMRELLKLNDDPAKGWDNLTEKINKQNVLISELKEHARKACSMTGRMIKFQHADSYAMYLVTKVNKTTCRLEWIDYCDGWQDGRLGLSGSLPIKYVHDQICHEDNLDKIFGQKERD